MGGLGGPQNPSERRGEEKDLVGFEVLTAVVMKNTIFWDITSCSTLKVNRCFGGNTASMFRVEE
jgi:hypothetical protein